MGEGNEPDPPGGGTGKGVEVAAEALAAPGAVGSPSRVFCLGGGPPEAITWLPGGRGGTVESGGGGGIPIATATAWPPAEAGVDFLVNPSNTSRSDPPFSVMMR
jgi:hypothetical protein